MKVWFAGSWLTGNVTSEEAGETRFPSQRQVQEVRYLRAPFVTPLDREGVSSSFSFQVAKQCESLNAALRETFTKFRGLPGSGPLRWEETYGDETVILQCPDAVLQGHEPNRIGVSVIHSFSFVVGQVLQVQDIWEDFLMSRHGLFEIPIGSDIVEVEFAAPLENTPTSVKPDVRKPTSGSDDIGAIDYYDVTISGFKVKLTSPPTEAGYMLDYLAIE